MAKTKKVYPPMAVNDLVKWIGKDHLSGIVLEVEEKRARVDFTSIGAGWVKRESLEVVE